MSEFGLDTPREPGGGYSEEEKARGLQAVALFNGNTRRAAKHLEQCGHKIPRTTLSSWQRSKPDEYERARVFVRDQIWDALAEEHQAVARKALRATEKATERAQEHLKANDMKGANTAASAARNLATVAGISNDKAAAAHGKPTQITERHGLSEITTGLRRLGVLEPEAATVDAEEVTELEA